MHPLLQGLRSGVGAFIIIILDGLRHRTSAVEVAA